MATPGRPSGDDVTDIVTACTNASTYVLPATLRGTHELTEGLVLSGDPVEAPGTVVLAVLPDADGDGIGEVLVGAPGYTDGALTQTGIVRGFSGPIDGDRSAQDSTFSVSGDARRGWRRIAGPARRRPE